MNYYMKILEIIPQLSSGGAERFTVDLCNELSKRHEVSLLLYFDLSTYNFFLQELSPNVKVYSMKKKKGFAADLSFRLFFVIRQLKPDIIHMHLNAITYLLPSILFYKAEYYMTIHNDAEKEAGGKIGGLIRQFCFSHNLVKPVTISEESCKSFFSFYGIKATMIYNGRNIPKIINIPPETIEEIKKYKHSPNTKIIVNLARINLIKRQPLLAKIASKLYNEGYDFSVLMIGNNKNKELVSEILSFKSPAVHILGERHNPLDYLSLADAYCLCSSYEGMPISLIEALGVGAIPICTPVGGIVNIVKDGINGLMIKDLSEESLYDALKRFLDLSDSKMTEIKIKAIESYKPFSMTECSLRYEQLFNNKNYVN